jgi:L-alanine-DL-glutamate epimerase-like enolase superfamily enzyme/pimeloyl-ACP methyl ester carboxylesterase
MIEQAVRIAVAPLRVKLKTTIRHAGATRKKGESVWVKAERNGIVGYGEGCPRSYVAGDDLESSVQWVEESFSNGEGYFKTFEDVKKWTERNSDLINKYPSAWCAIEMALLDFFSQEKCCNVEALLGLDGFGRRGRYTAVLGDDKRWKFTYLADKYLIRGFSDFKIKLNGDLERDKLKLEILQDLCGQHGVSDVRIRLDANNLWEGRTEEAIGHLKELKGPIFAVEEPIGPRDVEGINKVSTATGLPVILDESLCTIEDLSAFAGLPGKFIGNIKVSRVGGLIRALKLVEELKRMDWPIIIGCHVGETSLLTRAALIPANAAGENLIAQEGAFGDYLVEREPVEPILNFGRNGLLDLRHPYYLKTHQGLKVIPSENWNTGFGIQGRMPVTPDDGEPDIVVLEMPDKYNIHYRVWGSTEGEDVLIILHGGMSHSGWQAPLAKALQSMSRDISIVAPDRRGCGLNEKRGDMGSVRLVIDDVVRHIEFLKRSFTRVHLAGWCQGCQFASVAAARLGNVLSSLIFLTPGFFWNERFRSVINVTERIVFDMMSEFKLEPDRSQACIPIPMEPTDFTFKEEWLDFIENDELKTTWITMKTVSIMDEIQELSWGAFLQTHLPTLAILGENDRIVDNNKFQQFYGHMFSKESENRLARFDSCHAIQFERPGELSNEIFRFVKKTIPE